MLKSMLRAGVMPVAAACLWLPMHSDVVLAQSTPPLYISAVDLEIAPASMNRFLAALKVDGEAMIKEPGAREFDCTVAQKDPNHVFIFEVYNNAAAYDAHQKTDAYNKFLMISMMMLKNYAIRPFSSVAMNSNGNAPQFDQFLSASKDDAAAALGDPGVREFNIAVSQQDPHHLLVFEVYDDAAAHDAHVATDHSKAYQAATKDMVAKRAVTALSSVAMLTKSR